MSILGYVYVFEIYFKKGIIKVIINNCLDMVLFLRVKICIWIVM